jgi:hypothetical protein
MLSVGNTEMRTTDLCINSYEQWLQFWYNNALGVAEEKKKREISFLQTQ